MKRRLIYGLALVATVLITAHHTFAQRAHLQSKIDATEIVIGDQVRLFIELQSNPAREVVLWPRYQDTFNHLEIVSTSPIDTVKGNDLVTYKQQLVITGFDSGAFEIPAFTYTLKPANDSAYILQTEPYLLNVQTLDADTSKPFKDIKDIVPVPASWTDYLPLAAGVLVMVGLLAFVIYFFRKNKKTKAEKRLQNRETYWQRTMRLLDELGTAQIWEQGDVKGYYTQLTDILRQYLEDRFQIPAMEKTTEEINAIARKSPELRSYRKAIRDVLMTADMAKFAKAQPLPEEHIAALQGVKEFVQTTKPQASVNEKTESH